MALLGAALLRNFFSARSESGISRTARFSASWPSSHAASPLLEFGMTALPVLRSSPTFVFIRSNRSIRLHVKESRIGPGRGLEFDRAWAASTPRMARWVNGEAPPRHTLDPLPRSRRTSARHAFCYLATVAKSH